MRTAARSLLRSPRFTFIVVATLVLGIATITSVFSVIETAWYRPLPYQDADRIVALGLEYPGRGGPFSALPWSVLRQIRDRQLPFERLSAYQESWSNVTIGGEPFALRTVRVDTAFATMLAVAPAAGRWFTRDEILENALVVVISNKLWRTQFQQGSDAVGRTLTVGARVCEIIGIMPQGLAFPARTEIWLPLAAPSSQSSEQSSFVALLAKLRPDTPRDQARAALAGIDPDLEAIDPSVKNGVLVMRDEMADRGANGGAIAVLFALAAGSVLLLVCSNVGNLLLMRVGERQDEMAVRMALGATRSRLVIQTLVEGLVVACTAGVLGAIASIWGVRLIAWLLPAESFPSWVRFGLTARMLAFAAVTSLGTTLLVGLTPARLGTRADLRRLMGTGGSASRSVIRAGRRGLIAQIALATVLFVGAALVAKTYRNLTSVNVGYPAEQIVSLRPAFSTERYPREADRMRFLETITTRLASIPTVREVAVRGGFGKLRQSTTTDSVVSSWSGLADHRLFIDGDTSRSVMQQHFPAPRLFSVSLSYFRLVGLRLLKGRGLENQDGPGSPLAMVVSRRFADVAWGVLDPLGKSVQYGAKGERLTVIGVVEDVRDLQGGRRGFSAEPRADAYVTIAQAVAQSPEVLVVGAGDVQSTLVLGMQAAHELDGQLPVRGETLAASIDTSLLATRIVGSLFAFFAISALVLAIMGIYGVVAFGISQRTREIGIRMALGGTRQGVVGMILREGLHLALLGMAIGVTVSLGLSRLMRSLLFEVAPVDPLVYLLTCTVFSAVAFLAGYLPARRAARVDPVVALRQN